MAKTQEKHTHKFKRLKYKSGSFIFFCALPDCNQKLNISLALGKRSLCWRCGESFIMTEYSLRLAKPHCENCHKPKHNLPHFITSPSIVSDINEDVRVMSLSERLQQTVSKTLPAEIEDEL